MHNECSAQKYKETKAKIWVQYGRFSILSFDETEREKDVPIEQWQKMPFAVILDKDV